jgi:hypothetical protein
VNQDGEAIRKAQTVEIQFTVIWGAQNVTRWLTKSAFTSRECSPPLEVKAALRQKAIHYLHMGQQPSKQKEL